MPSVRRPLRPIIFVSALTLVAACGNDSAEVGADGATEGEGGSDGGSSDTQSSAGGSGTSGTGCVYDDGCPADAPICMGGQCRPCNTVTDSDDACAARDVDTPVCDAGRCVECTQASSDACGDTTPICDDEQRCVPCAAHDECDVACELDTGRCIERLIVVDPNGEGDAPTLTEALALVAEGESAAVQLRPFDSCYIESVEIPPTARVALLGPEDRMPCLTSLSDAPVVSVPEDGAAYLYRVRLDNAVGTGIEGLAANLWLQRSEVVNNQGGGVVFGQNSRVVIHNSIIGGDRNHVPAVSVRDSELEVSYSTLAAGFGDAVALTCGGESSVEVRNSILVAEASGGEVDCSDALIMRSALESAFGSGNVAVGEVDTAAWFVDFTGGDLHLQMEAAGMFDGVAMWSPQDPMVDLDGDPRPVGDEEQDRQDWAGADIPSVP